MSTQVINHWGPAIVIVVGYFLANHFQKKSLSEFKDFQKKSLSEFNHFQKKSLSEFKADLCKFLDAKFETVDVRLKHLEEMLLT